MKDDQINRIAKSLEGINESLKTYLDDIKSAMTVEEEINIKRMARNEAAGNPNARLLHNASKKA